MKTIDQAKKELGTQKIKEICKKIGVPATTNNMQTIANQFRLQEEGLNSVDVKQYL